MALLARAGLCGVATGDGLVYLVLFTCWRLSGQLGAEALGEAAPPGGEGQALLPKPATSPKSD